MSELSADEINEWQASGRFHPFTCRECRGGWDNCPRRSVGLAAGDHHVLRAREIGGHTDLICDCCGTVQDIPGKLADYVKALL